jgi:hypothetical protein
LSGEFLRPDDRCPCHRSPFSSDQSEYLVYGDDQYRVNERDVVKPLAAVIIDQIPVPSGLVQPVVGEVVELACERSLAVASYRPGL